MIESVADPAALTRAIARVPRIGQGHTSSFFANRERVAEWMRQGALSMLQTEGALLVLRRDRDFVRVYHVAAEPSALEHALSELAQASQEGAYVSDLVGHPDQLVPIMDTYRGAGFMKHGQLIRLQRINAGENAAIIPEGVRPAGAEDLSALQDMLERQLDPWMEKIPDAKELREKIDSGAALVAAQGSGIAGCLLYETIGVSTILRYWHMDLHLRNRGIGSRLMRNFLHRCAASRRILLWVIAGNTDAIDKYHHYGFREDGLVDNIMVRPLEPSTR